MQTPIILREGTYTPGDIAELKKQQVWSERDVYELQLSELFKIEHPAVQTDTAEFLALFHAYVEQKKSQPAAGDWVYLPWNGHLIHMVSAHDYNRLRTNRNRNIITEEEQETLRRFTVGIVGLSVGSHIATSLVYTGIADTMKVADFDTLDTTNLNRVRGGISDVGLKKSDLLQQQIFSVNPYATVEVYENGLTVPEIDSFLSGKNPPRLIFEIIDDFEMKIRLRLAARNAGVPVIMFSNVGDSTIIDIERYDLNKSLPLFNGIVGDLPEHILEFPDITDEMKNSYALKLVQLQNIPKVVFDSVMQIGKTLRGRPQLASTVIISGGVGAYLARQIALGHHVPSGRQVVRFDQTFFGVEHELYKKI